MREINRNAIERGRAEFAYKQVLRVKKEHETISGNYKSYVKKMPMLVKTNGLGAALAFIFSKGSNKQKHEKDYGYMLLYEDIAEWLKRDEKQLVQLEDNSDLIAKVISLESTRYRALTIEVLSFLNWLRRFADGLIEKGAQDE